MTDQIVIEIIPANEALPIEYRFVETITKETDAKARAEVRALKRNPLISGARMFVQSAAQVACIKEMMAA